MRHKATIFAVAAAVTAGLLSGGTASATPKYRNYVALGDSYVSIASLLTVEDKVGCFRSRDNYPHVLAAKLGVARLTDVSCGSATTEHMTTPQQTPLFGTNPPQFDALNPDVDLVTLTVGGNDFGLESTFGKCGLLSATNPFGNPCQQANRNPDGSDQFLGKIEKEVAPKVAAVVRGVTERAPNATVLLVGYLRLLPDTKGCWPAMPIAAGDVPYLNVVQQRLTDALTRNTGGKVVAFDPTSLTGHDACTAPGTRWVEPVLPASPTTPVHPNVLGQRNLGERLAAALR
ncbi:GDSL-like lipase/acylhydrolase family protein [Herbihabitans rhizosphaerae]|uniref:GDSL-like lipase/acylhydrolase family protein n=1 Tax=Herbihabitans rhizosphaerae TaxID=1872711 RepID=A0A4Q7L6G6_9PSEU|nr:SGNH/GDSL hydrolase family protein [Herbihabitans rhizosphaerae]RZS44856.1 GDSL-like lipase/acylhydrolase family protein [Herbihabitans rhizosphaerae]